MPFQLTLHGHLTQADQAANPYFYVPFVLPAEAQRLHVRYHYSAAMSSDQVDGGNVIDLGLFDPRGSDFPGGAGFRGWSGSARREFMIAHHDATPGYLPGPLPAGRYQIILGLYRIWEQGAEYEIEIEAELIEEQTAPPMSGAQWTGVNRYPPSPFAGEATLWLRGDLQSHTDHSDAKGSLEQLVGKARVLGLDFLAITDHNTISHHPHLAALADDRLLLLYGQEVTTYYGHMNVWGTQDWCDFRAKTPDDLAAIIEFAHAHGGLCSINHPKVGGPAWDYGFDLPFDTMEVWQGPWPYRNTESLALWDRLLAEGRLVRAVGGSDYHCPAGEETNLLRLGQPTTWVLAKERSRRGILEAIFAGRIAISAHPNGPRLLLQAATPDGKVMSTMGEQLSIDNAELIGVTVTVWDGAGFTLQMVVDGSVTTSMAITQAEQQISLAVSANTYVRAELVGDLPDALLPEDAPPGLQRRDWRWALTNPIFVTQTDGLRSSS